jgi:predicted alpha/beta hydrolase family esterase
MEGFRPGKTLLIGHSTGAPFLMRMAEEADEADEAYGGLFAVAPFARLLGTEKFDRLNASFLEKPFDWVRVRAGARRRVCFIGDNDPYVPLAEAEDVAKALEAERCVVKKGGHLNAAAGFTQFPELLAAILAP